MSLRRNKNIPSFDLVHFIPRSLAEERAKKMNYREEKKLEMHLKHIEDEERFASNILTKNHVWMNRNVDRLHSSKEGSLSYTKIGKDGRLHVQLNRTKLLKTKKPDRLVRPTMMSDSSANRLFHKDVGQMPPNLRLLKCLPKRSMSEPFCFSNENGKFALSHSDVSLRQRDLNSTERIGRIVSSECQRFHPRYSLPSSPTFNSAKSREFSEENIRLEKREKVAVTKLNNENHKYIGKTLKSSDNYKISSHELYPLENSQSAQEKRINLWNENNQRLLSSQESSGMKSKLAKSTKEAKPETIQQCNVYTNFEDLKRIHRTPQS